jgi:8-amino-7-oxononanoate synthase
MRTLDDVARAELDALEADGRLRSRRTVSGRQGVRIVLDGREVTSFSSNDYLGLAGHPALAEAAAESLRRTGTGAGASRLIVGNSSLHEDLERSVCSWLELPAAVLFSSGFAANTGVLPVIAGAGDVILSDELNHASIIDGCRLSRADTVIYRHRDLADLDRALAAQRGRRAIVVTETLFSMDGDVPDLVALDGIRRRHGAALIVDEAHALGAMGEGGRGLALPVGVVPDLLVGTFGKALGVAGAFVAGSRALIDLLWNRARPLVFSTAPPPALAAASRAAIELVRSSDGDARRVRLAANAQSIREALRSDAEGAIQPVRVGDDRATMQLAASLLEAGLYVQGIRPPTVPVGTSRLRIALSSEHGANDLESLNNALRRFT